MQLSEDSSKIEVPMGSLSFLTEVDVEKLDPQTFFKFTQLVVMTQMKLDDPTDGSAIGVDFQAIYEKITGMDDGKKERIASEDPASKTNSAIVSEVRALLRRKLPLIYSEEDGANIEVMKDPLTDDFMNVIEVASSIKEAESDDKDKNLAIGVTFLNKHCFVNDLKPSKSEKGPSLLKRSVEIKLEIMEQILGWTLLIIDEAEYLEMFN